MVFRVRDSLWRLEFCRPNSPNLLRSNGTRTVGVSDNSVKTVWIADNLSDYMVDKVLCHELVHVYCFEKNYYVDISTEEIIADFMSLYGRDIIYLADKIMDSVLKIAA